MKRANLINRFSIKIGFLVLLGIVILLAFAVEKNNHAAAYYFGNPKIDIGEVDLYLFYAVPSDKETHDFDLVKSSANKVLGDVSNFHNKQFLGKSKIASSIFPSPLMLRNKGIEYDTEDTRRGNWEALKSITLEIESRVFDKKGDLYNEEFIGNPKGYRVIAIIYEGVGASGTEGSLILSRDFLTVPQYEPSVASLFYHEFGHTIGMPEGYDINTGQAFSNDIMGGGRHNPIETNYIDDTTLRRMGVLNSE